MDLTKTISLFFAAALLIYADRGVGEVRVVVTTGFDIELTEDETVAIYEAPSKLIVSPSRHLVAAIAAGDADATVLDQRGDVRVRYPLMLLINYPAVSVNKFRTFRPAVVCEGSIYPAVWDYCIENSDTHITIPGHGRIHVDHESITRENAEQMIAFLDTAKLESPQGESIAGKDVHKIRYREDLGLYSLMGHTAEREHFSIDIRPTSNSDARMYEISDWSYQ